MPDSPSNEAPGKNAGTPSQGAPASSRSRRTHRPQRARRLIDTAGPDPNTPIEHARLTVGKIAGAHGVQGEVRMTLLTDDPDNLLDIKRVYLGDSDTPVTLDGIRFHGDGALIFIEGIETPEDAKALRGTPVRIAGSDARPLAAGEFFHYQLIGLRAVTAAGETLGEVVDLIETGAHDVLVIAPAGSPPSRSPANELLIPLHDSYVHTIDPDAGVMVVSRPDYGDANAANTT